MKTLTLLTLATVALALLPACQVDWQKAAAAAAEASAPIVLDGLNKPAAKQPVKVVP